MKTTIKAYRVTFLVDEGTFAYLAKGHGYNEDPELWEWEDTQEVAFEIEVCEDCGSRYQMQEFACTNNEGYCMDCCYCSEHWPETEQMELDFQS